VILVRAVGFWPLTSGKRGKIPALPAAGSVEMTDLPLKSFNFPAEGDLIQ
jgi:hypothetical protein